MKRKLVIGLNSNRPAHNMIIMNKTWVDDSHPSFEEEKKCTVIDKIISHQCKQTHDLLVSIDHGLYRASQKKVPHETTFVF